jgi:non-ribosomal peptide synthase protein (TIGR01720 family)
LSGRAEIMEELKSAPQAEVCFTYLGQFDQRLNAASFFALARESPGPFSSERGMRSHLLDVLASVVEGQLNVSWIYSRNRHHPKTIENLAHDFTERLIDLSNALPAAQLRQHRPANSIS